MYPLSHKEIIEMLFVEYPGLATTAEFNSFCFKFKNDQIKKDDIEEEMIDVLYNECRKAFEAGIKAAIEIII